MSLDYYFTDKNMRENTSFSHDEGTNERLTFSWSAKVPRDGGEERQWDVVRKITSVSFGTWLMA